MKNRCLKHAGALKVFFISDFEKNISWNQIRGNSQGQLMPLSQGAQHKQKRYGACRPPTSRHPPARGSEFILFLPERKLLTMLQCPWSCAAGKLAVGKVFKEMSCSRRDVGLPAFGGRVAGFRKKRTKNNKKEIKQQKRNKQNSPRPNA